MNKLRNILTILLSILITMAGLTITSIIILNKPLPKGEAGPAAEAFADSILAAVNVQSWDRLRFVAWTHNGKRHYVWDKLYNLAELRYDNMRILLNVNTIDGIVWKDGVRLSGVEKPKYIASAWKSWCHDLFWLSGAMKIRDPGTIRKLVMQKNSKSALLVTYTQGGLTPGDSYLWIVDDNYLPVEWRMWARSLPVKGIKASWDGWTAIDSAWCSTTHKIGPLRIALQDLRSGRHYSEMGLPQDPFVDFVPE